jgi:hypothetical protein
MPDTLPVGRLAGATTEIVTGGAASSVPPPTVDDAEPLATIEVPAPPVEFTMTFALAFPPGRMVPSPQWTTEETRTHPLPWLTELSLNGPNVPLPESANAASTSVAAAVPLFSTSMTHDDAPPGEIVVGCTVDVAVSTYGSAVAVHVPLSPGAVYVPVALRPSAESVPEKVDAGATVPKLSVVQTTVPFDGLNGPALTDTDPVSMPPALKVLLDSNVNGVRKALLNPDPVQ